MRSRKQVTGFRRQAAGVLLCLIPIAAAQADLSVSLKPEAASLFVHEPFTLLLEADLQIEWAPPPNGAGFSVIQARPGADGKTGRIEVVADQPGILNFPPFPVRSGDETVQTPPLRLTVSAPRPADEMSLSIHLSSTNLYVNEPVELTVTWGSRVPFTRCTEVFIDIPLLRHPAWSIYPQEPGVPESERVGLPVNFQRVIARKNTSPELGDQLIGSFLLIPSAPEVFRPSAAQMSCALLQTSGQANRYPSYFDNHFFAAAGRSARFERIFLSRPFPPVTVRALPEKGRTARYCGVIGDCSVFASVQPEQATVGQPMLLTVTFDQLRFGPGLSALPEASFASIASGFRRSSSPIRETTSQHSRSFTYILRPLRSGLTEIPALVFETFDPEREEYRKLRTEPLAIQVDPDGEQTFYQPFADGARERKVPLASIRGNWRKGESAMTACHLLNMMLNRVWLFWLLPPLLAAALRPWFRHRDRCRADAAYARASLAARRFRRAVKKDEEAAWRNYLADRLNLHPEVITFETVRILLEKQGVRGELMTDLHRRFFQHDAGKYAPPPVPPESQTPSVRTLVRKIEKATRAGLAIICLLFTFSTQAGTPQERFDEAMKLRNLKPDEAQPLFVEAALGFETDGKFFNAGNSWYFAGENGRALANYLAAERIRPLNKEIRESIAFIRAQRPDNFQISDARNTLPFRAWKRFERGSPSIRSGLLTLIYLAGWMLYFSNRITGRSASRKIWIALTAPALPVLLSLIWSLFRLPEGVVIQSAEARLGPGYAYDRAYETLLTETTEFEQIEERDGWIHVRLPDGNAVWLREDSVSRVK